MPKSMTVGSPSVDMLVARRSPLVIEVSRTFRLRSSCTVAGTITGHTDVPANNEDALKAAVALQPVSVAIEADQQGFQSYSGGVFSGNCGTQLDHGVLAVGYGTDSGSDYWLVKNSWGASWGDQGFIKMARGTGSGSAGQCGIAADASYPQA